MKKEIYTDAPRGVAESMEIGELVEGILPPASFFRNAKKTIVRGDDGITRMYLTLQENENASAVRKSRSKPFAAACL